MRNGQARAKTAGGVNWTGQCPVCRTKSVELLEVEDFYRMCSPCLVTLIDGWRRNPTKEEAS